MGINALLARWRNTTASATDTRRKQESIRGGRRQGESDNPYLSARRTWNDYVSSQIASRRMWQLVAILALMIVLAAVGGLVHIGSQAKYIPYVIEVDNFGQTKAAGELNPTITVDPRVIRAAVADFIVDARLVTPDVSLQREAVFRVYAKLTTNDPATQKMNEWLNGENNRSPFERAKTEMVTVDIKTVLPISESAWQIDWLETVRERSGAVRGTPVEMRALVTVYVAGPDSAPDEQAMRRNPLGIYVRDFSWSKRL